MKSHLFSLFVLSFFLIACETETAMEVPEETKEHVMGHYEGRFMSFDYPTDIEVYLVQQGEGALVDSVAFMEWSEEYGAYMPLGPVIDVRTYWGDLDAQEYFGKERSEAEDNETFKVITLAGAEAFQVNSGGGICDDWDLVYFTFPHKLSNGDEFDATGVFTADFCAGNRYEEILNLFLQTVRFK